MRNLFTRLVKLEESHPPKDKDGTFALILVHRHKNLAAAVENLNRSQGLNFTVDEVKKWNRMKNGKEEILTHPDFSISKAVLRRKGMLNEKH